MRIGAIGIVMAVLTAAVALAIFVPTVILSFEILQPFAELFADRGGFGLTGSDIISPVTIMTLMGTGGVFAIVTALAVWFFTGGGRDATRRRRVRP